MTRTIFYCGFDMCLRPSAHVWYACIIWHAHMHTWPVDTKVYYPDTAPSILMYRYLVQHEVSTRTCFMLSAHGMLKYLCPVPA
jgi:hypothetical protein